MKRRTTCLVCGTPLRRDFRYFCSGLCRQVHNTGKSRDQLVYEAGLISDSEIHEHDRSMSAQLDEPDYFEPVHQP